MAEHPAGESDFEPVFYQRDDHQPRADYGDIDKGESIANPLSLDEVVDRAVQFLRGYSDMPDVLRQVISDIDTYLEKRTMSQITADPTIDFEVIEPIENLVTASVSYFNGILESGEAQRAIDNLLRQYCQKVLEVLRGCLQARLKFKDDLQVSHFIEDLRNLAKNVRDLIIGNENEFKKQVKEILAKSVRPREHQLVEELLVGLRKRVRVEIAVAELKDFLNGLVDDIQVVIMVKICPQLAPRPPADLEKYREVLDHFTDYKYTHKALSEMFEEAETFSSSGMAELTLGEITPEQKEEYKSLGASGVGGAEGGPKSGPGPLSPPPAVRQAELKPWKSQRAMITDLSPDTTYKQLFDLFKPFGTIRYVVVARDGKGFVSFFSSDGVEKAIEGLSDRVVTMSKTREPLEQKRSGTEVIVQELPLDFSEVDMTSKLSGYELERVTLRLNKDSAHKHCYLTFKSGEDAEKALTSLQDQGLFAILAKPRRQ